MHLTNYYVQFVNKYTCSSLRSSRTSVLVHKQLLVVVTYGVGEYGVLLKEPALGDCKEYYVLY